MTEDYDHATSDGKSTQETADADLGGGSGPVHADTLSAQRVFKKSSPNGKLTLYLCTRDLVVTAGRIDRLLGVLMVDPEYIEQRKVYGQLTLTFRYGREDEEVMGLKFCNEAVMCLAQLYPPHASQVNLEPNTPLQEALIKRLGSNAYPFTMEITPLAPPSVQLVPAKDYRGAPIGTSYDIRAYVAERADEKLHKRATVRMGLRVVQRAGVPPTPTSFNPTNGSNLFFSNGGDSGATNSPRFSGKAFDPASSTEAMLTTDNEKGTTGVSDVGSTSGCRTNAHTLSVPEKSKRSESMETDAQSDKASKSFLLKENNSNVDVKKRDETTAKKSWIEIEDFDLPGPRGTIVKTFMMSDGRIELEGSLDKSIYSHGEAVQVNVQINNFSHKTVRRIKVFIVQHVDVCMFSNGKFKNVVAIIDTKEGFPLTSGTSYSKVYSLRPIKGSTKNWIALEDSYSKSGTSLASTVRPTGSGPDERNVFAIYVSYYVKIKLVVSVTTSEVSLKLPFTLMHTCNDVDYDFSPVAAKDEKENIADLPKGDMNDT